jgi:hypothetical protein
MKKLMAVFALGFALGGCGVAPGEELVPVSSVEQELDNGGGYTTRDICTKCGCTATDVACDCGTPPSKSKLACIENGGPIKKIALGGIATSPVTTVTGGSESLQPESLNFGGLGGGKVPFCPEGEHRYCDGIPVPICTCVPNTTTTTGTVAR